MSLIRVLFFRGTVEPVGTPIHIYAFSFQRIFFHSMYDLCRKFNLRITISSVYVHFFISNKVQYESNAARSIHIGEFNTFYESFARDDNVVVLLFFIFNYNICTFTQVSYLLMFEYVRPFK